MKKFYLFISSTLVWSVIAAAFIGPGTITTAASAGSAHGLQLLWAMLFSLAACFVLQESSARLSLLSGKNLSAFMAARASWPATQWLVPSAVVVGCAAYQAGNIMGAVAGLGLLIELPSPLLALLVAVVCSVLLWLGNIRRVAAIMGLVVAAMGVLFVWMAPRVSPAAEAWVQGIFAPSLPEGSTMLAIGLIGTTIVPYNIFLGSGIGQGQRLWQMRRGIALAVATGGVISVAIMVAGSLVALPFSLEALALAIRSSIGYAAALCFALGLFAAGFTSATTAPLAASLVVAGAFPHTNTKRLRRLTWGGVMLFGLFWSLTGIRPVPVILLAQAVNGLLLPFVSIFLFRLMNNASILPAQHCNRPLANILLVVVNYVVVGLGLLNLTRAVLGALSIANYSDYQLIVPVFGLSLLWNLYELWKVYKHTSIKNDSIKT